MFGKCLWLKIKNKDIIDMHKSICDKFSHISFSPHVTICTKINDKYVEKYIEIFKTHKPKIIIDFSKSIICDCCIFDNVEFYSIYIYVKVIDCPMPKGCNPHLSLAYRINNNFSKKNIQDIIGLLKNNYIECDAVLAVETCELTNSIWKGTEIKVSQ